MDYKESVFNLEIPFRQGHIVYNTYSGALILIKQPLHEYFQTNSLDDLVKQGFLVDSRLNEVNRLIVERNRELYTSRIKYLHIEIAPTMKCQARCWYCFEHNYGQKHTMTKKIAADTVDYIKNRITQSQCDEFCLLFFGGEPLLAFDSIMYIGSKIKAFCNEKNVKFHSEIITNGIGFTLDIADRIVSEIALTKVQITLDGLKATHDAAKGISCFDAVVKNIVETADRTNISVRINVSSKNKSEIADLVNYLLNEKHLDGKIRIYLARVDDLDSCGFPDNSCLDNFSFVDFRNTLIRTALKKYKSFLISDLLPDIKRNYCGYEKISQIMIGPSGELYRCQRMLGSSSNAIGDIYSGSFYPDQELSLLRTLDVRCIQSCNLLPTCFGGCPNERRKGSPISYCTLKREQVEKDIITYVETLLDN